MQVAAVASAAVLLSMIVDLNSSDIAPLPDRALTSPQNGDQWDAYGGNKAGTRYAPLDQINRDNVHKLTRVWEAETGMVGRLSATPLQIGDGIYLCTAQNIMLALDADTGAERWRFDPENDTRPTASSAIAEASLTSSCPMHSPMRSVLSALLRRPPMPA